MVLHPSKVGFILCEGSPRCYIHSSEMVLFPVKGVGVLGALDDGPGGHQLYERSACEKHHLEVVLVSGVLECISYSNIF